MNKNIDLNNESDITTSSKEDVHEVLSSYIESGDKRFGEVEKSASEFIDDVASQFPEKEQAKIYDALLLMFDLHLGQRDRDGGEPYVTHLVSVAGKVLGMQADKDLVISALLHDSIEDQAGKISLSDIEQRYGERVRKVVADLSEPDFDNILAGRDLSKDNKEEYRREKYKIYAEHVAETIEDPDCLVVKLADFTDNISELSDLPEDKEKQVRRKRNLTNKYLPVMDIFLERLQRDNLFPEYQEKIKNEQSKIKQNME